MQLGLYSELALQRLDLILAEAGKNGIRIMFPFVNYWPDLGGMQWYVDQVRECLPLLYEHANRDGISLFFLTAQHVGCERHSAVLTWVTECYFSVGLSL